MANISSGKQKSSQRQRKDSPLKYVGKGKDQDRAALLEALPDAFLSVNTQWQITYVNRQAEAVVGKTREDLLGRNIWEVLPVPTASPVYLKAHEAMGKQSSLELTKFHPLLKKWFAVRLYPFQDGLYAFAQDITEQKQAEAEEQLLYYARLAQNNLDAVITTDTNYNIVSWNEAAEMLYGWKQEEVLGKYVNDVLPTQFFMTIGSEASAVLRSRGYWKGKVIQPRKDGTPLTILASVAVIKDGLGKMIGAVAANRDMSE